MEITSEQNPRIKNILKLLEKSKERKKQQKFIVEGVQENTFALDFGYQLLEIFVNESIFFEEISFPISVEKNSVSQNVYDKIAYRKTTEGIIGIYKYPDFSLENFPLAKQNSILAVESIEKPGNLGAVFRSADAMGIDAVFLLDERVDIFNPNVIRSSVGSVFTIPVYSISNEKFMQFCIKNEIHIFGTFMNEKSTKLTDIQFPKKTALLFGTESTGLSDFWKDKITENFQIPMQGKVDSLNISNAVAISLYELKKQI